ncbi:MAG: hypothetical protein WD278_04045 [Pirellulales bacterium]
MATSLDNPAVTAACLLALFFAPIALAVLLARLEKRRRARPPRFRVTLADSMVEVYVLCDRKTYRLSPASIAAARFLRQVARWRALHAGETPVRFISFKADFRRLLRAGPLAGLIWTLRYGKAEAQWMAVWLLGRFADGRVAAAVKPFYSHPDQRIRKHAMRGVRRLLTIEGLERLAAEENDPAHGDLETAGLRRSFSNRLTRYLEGVEGTGAADEPPGMEWFLAHELDEPVLPKSPSFIRRLLEHIRRLVHPTAADEEVRVR